MYDTKIAKGIAMKAAKPVKSKKLTQNKEVLTKVTKKAMG